MNNRFKSRRKRDGSSLTELGPALIVFVCAFLIPVIDISFVPVRYMICQGVINEFAHSLSLVEKRSEAYSRLAANSWWIAFSPSVESRSLTPNWLLSCAARA